MTLVTRPHPHQVTAFGGVHLWALHRHNVIARLACKNHISIAHHSTPPMKSTPYRWRLLTFYKPPSTALYRYPAHRPLQRLAPTQIFRTSFSNSHPLKMSGKEFSNADTGSKPADPYKEKNYEEVSVKQKVEDLVAFIEKCQFSMMTTRQAQTGLLVSRCMALAGKVRL